MPFSQVVQSLGADRTIFAYGGAQPLVGPYALEPQLATQLSAVGAKNGGLFPHVCPEPASFSFRIRKLSKCRVCRRARLLPRIAKGRHGRTSTGAKNAPYFRTKLDRLPRQARDNPQRKLQKTSAFVLHSELCKSSGCPGYPGLGDARAWYEVGTTTTASLMGAQVTKRAFAPFYTKNRTFCQDRPGTNIEKIETKDPCFLAEALRKRHAVARELGAARQGHCVFTVPESDGRQQVLEKRESE
jgi:hypothetical protein